MNVQISEYYFFLKMDEKAQEKCWLEELMAKNREVEMNECATELIKKKALHDDIAKQVKIKFFCDFSIFKEAHCKWYHPKQVDFRL